MLISEFIKKRPHLVWSTKNYEGLSGEVIVEAVLNYGNWEDVQKMIKILGMSKTARIFRQCAFRKRSNYHNITKHYFNLFFNKYAKTT